MRNFQISYLKSHFSILKAMILFVLFISLPIMSRAQSDYSTTELKSVSAARGKAVRGVIFPVALGVGSTLVFDNNIVETTGSWLAVYGIVMGPSIGNFYAKDYLRGFLGAAARIGGGYLISDATREIFGKDMAEVVGWDNEKVSLTDPKILIGSALIVGSAIYNIITVEASVESYNKEQGYLVRVYPAFRRGRVMPFITARFNF